MSFNWHPDESPPQIEPHSKAKLRVLRSYLRAYFDRLGAPYVREEFKLDLVDGFAGGGVFRDGPEVISGTPLIMLEEAQEAKTRLSQGRSKPIRFGFKFYFVDVNPAHTDHLRRALADRGYDAADDETTVIRTGEFANHLQGILQEIGRRQPRAGRSLFLLDQCGYSRVALQDVAKILDTLPTAEVILTFATDALINFLRDAPEMVRAVAPLDITDQQVQDLVGLKQRAGKALVQRALRVQIRHATAARFDTPFFIRPASSARALWSVHLSRHPTARDVMIQRHWELANTFEHFGRGGLHILGWDPRGDYPLFEFGEAEQRTVHEELLASVPPEIHKLAAESSITVDALRHVLANETAARFSDLDSVLLELYRAGELETRLATGDLRGRSTVRLKPTDLIEMPRQLSLFVGRGGGRQQ